MKALALVKELIEIAEEYDNPEILIRLVKRDEEGCVTDERTLKIQYVTKAFGHTIVVQEN